MKLRISKINPLRNSNRGARARCAGAGSAFAYDQGRLWSMLFTMVYAKNLYPILQTYLGITNKHTDTA